jgi:Alcohol dehydrogenase, class IV
MKTNWNYPTSLWVGEDRIKDLSEACKNLKISTPLFVTDKDLINLQMTKNIIFEVKKKFSTLVVFSNFSGNPIGENVEEGVLEFKKNKCDGVIAFGGGSGLDVGKAIAFMSGQSRPIWDFEDIGDYWKRANEKDIAPIIAVPTTAGTGSETGRASAIINKVTGIKKIIFHPKIFTLYSYKDPVLTIELSPRLTAVQE